MNRCWALAALLAAALPAAAQGLSDRLDTTWSLRADGWSGSRQLDDAGGIGRASVWLRSRLDLGEAGSIVGAGWVAAQTERTAPGHGGRLRELYWRASHGPFEARLGRQNIVWGRADGINPTDNLAPRDFTLLVPEDNDQRRGTEVAQVSVDTGTGVLTALWFPHGASHVLPLPTQPGVAYAVPGAPRRSQWALKHEMTGDGIDGSVSYFDGTDPVPDFAVAAAGPAGVQVLVRNNRLRVLGADLSVARQGVIWRAEAAWMRTDSRGPADFERKKPRLWVVAGAEWPLAGSVTLGLQASLQHVKDFADPGSAGPSPLQDVARRQAAVSNQTAATQAGVVWRLAGRWLNDTLMLETSGVATGSPDSRVWRLRASYAVNDQVQLQAGTDHYSGHSDGAWGVWRRNRLAFVQMRYAL